MLQLLTFPMEKLSVPAASELIEKISIYRRYNVGKLLEPWKTTSLFARLLAQRSKI